MKSPNVFAVLFAVALLAGCAAIDRSERNLLVQHNVSPTVYDAMLHGDPLSLSDIIELSRRQVPSGFIIRYLRATEAIYSLDKQALGRLKQGNTSQEVIDYLLETPSMFAPRPYYYGRPYYAPDAYYPYYPPYYRAAPVMVVRGRYYR